MATLRTRSGDPVRVKTALELGVLIRSAREARGWTQAELADRANVSRQWLVAVEKGRHSRAEIGLLLRTIATVGVELSARLPKAAEQAPRLPAGAVRATPAPRVKTAARTVRAKKSVAKSLPASARVNLDDVLDRARRG
jgi:transcriptional regulator with XRE-family HTH domain